MLPFYKITTKNSNNNKTKCLYRHARVYLKISGSTFKSVRFGKEGFHFLFYTVCVIENLNKEHISSFTFVIK